MPAVIHTNITRVNATGSNTATDSLAVEEPLEIRLQYGKPSARSTKSISVTMRTPGNDEELATGFLYTEGIIKSKAEISGITHPSEHVVIISLTETTAPDISKLERNFYTTSSCGVCGKASIEAVRIACNVLDTKDNLQIQAQQVYALPDILREQQQVFGQTGGLHAVALFNLNNELLMLREDVGRHNALDKLAGAALNQELLPLSHHILLLSGRASFELIQKAAMMGIKIVAAVGAPSSLAVELAEDWGMTLIGFLRGERFNIYSGKQRIII